MSMHRHGHQHRRTAAGSRRSSATGVVVEAPARPATNSTDHGRRAGRGTQPLEADAGQRADSGCAVGDPIDEHARRTTPTGRAQRRRRRAAGRDGHGLADRSGRPTAGRSVRQGDQPLTEPRNFSRRLAVDRLLVVVDLGQGGLALLLRWWPWPRRRRPWPPWGCRLASWRAISAASAGSPRPLGAARRRSRPARPKLGALDRPARRGRTVDRRRAGRASPCAVDR